MVHLEQKGWCMWCVRKIRFSGEEIAGMLESLNDYMWVAIDVERGIIAGGDELITRLRRELLESGCNICNVFGIGVDLVTGEIDYYSEINVKRIVPDSTKEVPMERRDRIERLVRYFFGELPVFKNERRGRYVRYEGVIV